MVKPVCFMVMPFNVKEIRSTNAKAPAKVNFDLLWDRAFRPAIELLGYEAVRADEDVGSMIIQEMIQRLALADLIVADVTAPNGNVYYEIGVRHAMKNKGCVLLAADWSEQLFDISQMRAIRYALPEQEVSPDIASAIQEKLKSGIPGLATGVTPVYSVLPDFPDIDYDADHVTAFRETLAQLSDFQRQTRAVRSMAKEARGAAAEKLKEKCSGGLIAQPAALELMYLLRDYCGWQKMLEFIRSLPADMQSLPVIQEQHWLGEAETGNVDEAIGALEQLIHDRGDTPERRGLLGGRYKRKFQAAAAAKSNDQFGFLEAAISNYEAGMFLDLNQYYCSSNLPRLYRLRNEEGDRDRAALAASVTQAAAERALQRRNPDEWLKPTLLGSAFDAGLVEKASQLALQVRKEGPVEWKLASTLRDLEVSAKFHGGAVEAELRKILNDLAGMITEVKAI